MNRIIGLFLALVTAVGGLFSFYVPPAGADFGTDYGKEERDMEDVLKEATSQLDTFEEEPEAIIAKDSNKEVENSMIEVPKENKAVVAVSTTSSSTKTNSSTPKAQITTNVYSMPYYLKVNLTQNVVNVYTKDESGDYNVPFKVMLCSTGKSTPKSGKVHKITTYRREWNGLFGNVYGQYATQIIGNILFHSVPYTQKSKDSLEYWEYDKLGTSASLGCIRLAVKDAKWVYENCLAGTIVEFYEDDNPGPLGKPSPTLISENEELRGWDPTDPSADNPWHVSVLEQSGDVNINEEIETLDIISGEFYENNATISGEIINLENNYNENDETINSGEIIDSEEIINVDVIDTEEKSSGEIDALENIIIFEENNQDELSYESTNLDSNISSETVESNYTSYEEVEHNNSETINYDINNITDEENINANEEIIL